MRPLRSSLLSVSVFVSALAGCGGSSHSSGSGGCAANPSSCQAGQVCEAVTGGGSVCTAPVQLSGKVFDVANPTPGISGARVVALDASQAPVAPASATDGTGHYAITVPATRNPDGSPTGSLTLRADAAGYLTFPSGLRPAIPVSLSGATLSSGMYQVTTATDIGLVALAAGSYAALHGTVAAAPSKGGILVVAAPAAGGTGVSGFADQNGAYYVYNLPVAAGGTAWTVRPYAQGANYTTGTALPVTLVNGDDKVVDFTVASTPTYTLGGTVQFTGQNLPPAPQKTSVILAVKSTFDQSLHRGEAPPGLRDGNVVSGINTFTIPGVPDGDYVVLAAFENDGMVQDTGQGSTGQYEAVISGGTLTQVLLNGTVVSNSQIAFKITGAISLAAPFTGTYDSAPWPAGSNTPTFDWLAYPSTDHYDIQVIDYLGNVACAKTGILTTDPTSFTWNATDCASATAQAGTWYQFLVRAYQLGVGTPLASRSEDLKGVFYMP
jgi:hypothetical protein